MTHDEVLEFAQAVTEGKSITEVTELGWWAINHVPAASSL